MLPFLFDLFLKIKSESGDFLLPDHVDFVDLRCGLQCTAARPREGLGSGSWSTPSQSLSLGGCSVCPYLPQGECKVVFLKEFASSRGWPLGGLAF